MSDEPKPTQGCRKPTPTLPYQGGCFGSPSDSPPDKGEPEGVSVSEGVAATAWAFRYIPYDRRLVECARENRRHVTIPERCMWQILTSPPFKIHKFLRQKPLDRFIADFYCAKLLLVIEVDGDSHDKQIEYDQLRTERLSEFGMEVIRYTNDEVMDYPKRVVSDLMTKIANRISETRQPSETHPLEATSLASSPLSGRAV